MKQEYLPQEIEEKWQRRWAAEKTFEVCEDPAREKFYCLEMLAYTSGRAHMGHVSNYSIGDALSWYKRMRGYNVLHPFGWDAFGQPAETAAIKDGTDPEEFTRTAIATMKSQLRRMGMSYDWSREIATCDPEYYRWNQWFFIRMFERGMLYRKLSPVNWCPKEEISLSNEQASGGRCWRCGTPVVQKELLQWFARITDFADELLEGFDQLEGRWPDRVITMQRNWIGRSCGAHVRFDIADTGDTVTVFTTRIDTIFGANAIILAPEHPLLEKIVKGKPQRDDMLAFAEEVKHRKGSSVRVEELDRMGVFTGSYAVNPFNRERLPVWIANFVLTEYGTGAIMAVPSADQRDFEFSRRYGTPFRQIKRTEDGREIAPDEMQAADESWTVTTNTGQWSGLPSKEANRLMTEYAEARGFGKAAVAYKLRDWGISRQRYWGTPVPMIHCPVCGIVPVPDRQLPVLLPNGVNLAVQSGSPLDHVPEYVNVSCPNCSRAARRDTDTMDTFVDSSWYYHRYCDPHNDRRPFDPPKVAYWLPVDQYIGGIEHAVMHLIYTRYWNRVMRDLGLVKIDEPVARLLTQGMIVKEPYRCAEHDWLYPEDVKEHGMCGFCGRPVQVGRMEKMSKTKKNVVDPTEIINIHGADALRLFVLFAGPPEKDKEWSDLGVEGAVRYLQGLWRNAWKWQERIAGASADGGIDSGDLKDYQRQLRRRVHQTIRAITENFEGRLHLNTCISSLMELTNELHVFDQAIDKRGNVTASDVAVAREALEALIRMLAPFVPHISEELWEGFGHGESLARAEWPRCDAELASEEQIEVAVQVNGKLRSRFFARADAGDDELRRAALTDRKVVAAMTGKDVTRIVVIPRKLVNIVTG